MSQSELDMDLEILYGHPSPTINLLKEKGLPITLQNWLAYAFDQPMSKEDLLDAEVMDQIPEELRGELDNL